MKRSLVGSASVTMKSTTSIFPSNATPPSNEPYPASAIPVLTIEEILIQSIKLKKNRPNLPPETSHQLHDEIRVICRQINSPKFPDFSLNNSVSLQLGYNSEIDKLKDVVHEMCLAYELSQRLDKTGWYWLKVDENNIWKCVTQKVIAAVLLSQQWIPNVTVAPPEPRHVGYSLRSSVVKRQAEGLIRFAEVIKWPYVNEIKEFIEGLGAVDSLRYVEFSVAPYVWDWFYGLLLPGTYFSHIIIITLVYTSRSTKTLTAGPASDFGLVIDGRSYWRQTTVMGRVLGGLDNIRSSSGWIGPCPPPRNRTIKGWARVLAPYKQFPKSQYVDEEENELEPKFRPGMDIGLLHPQPGEDPMEYLDDVEDWSKYLFPEPPAPSKVTCKLRSLVLDELPVSEELKGHRGKDYKASLEFDVNDIKIVYTLNNTPAFVPSQLCFKGPHIVPSRELPDLSNIWDISKLKDAPDPMALTAPLIINATCTGGELLARAWCAEIGSNAVIRREKVNPTCFACAVQMASNRGLGTNVLIWS